MGLKEQLAAGASLKRSNVGINIAGSYQLYSGSFPLGKTFIITSARSSIPCRIRLYGDSGSRNNAEEITRPYISQSISGSISLIADINLTDTSTLQLYPPLFGANLDTPVSASVYYSITSSSVQLSGTNTITINRFLLEDPNASTYPGVTTREHYLITGSVPIGTSISGSIETPKTYLLLQVIPNTSPIRLRLYTDATYRDNPAEKSRTFGVEPSASSGIIADMYIDTTETSSFTPVVLGRNMETPPTSSTYYTLTNNGLISGVTASLYLFSLED